MSDLLTTNESVNDTLANNGFWPDLSLVEFKAIARSDGTVEDHKLVFDMQTAVLKVNDQLKGYQSEQILAGVVTVENVDIVHHYKRAVYETTKAFLLETYRDLDTRKEGHDRADQHTLRIDSSYANATIAVNTILGDPDRMRVYSL